MPHGATHTDQARPVGLAANHARAAAGLSECCVASTGAIALAYDDFAALLASVESGAVAPLRGSWLLALYERGGRLQRRQELPAEAFWSAAELRQLIDTVMLHFSDDPQARAQLCRPHSLATERYACTRTC